MPIASSSSSSLQANSESSFKSSTEELPKSLRFSQLSTKSGSDTNLASRSPLQNRSRKSSYASQIGSVGPSGGAIGHKTFMSESCDNLNVSAMSSLADFQRLLIIWHKLTSISPLPTRSHKYKMKVYPNTFLGEELIAWLYDQESLTIRGQAVNIAQALLDGELIADASIIVQDDLGGLGQPRFHGAVPYKVKERKRFYSYNEEFNEDDENEEREDDSQLLDDLPPDWLQDMEYASSKSEQASVSKVIHNKDESSVTLSSPVEHKDLGQYIKEHDVQDTPDADDEACEIPCPMLDDVYKRHQSIYLQKLLGVEGLEESFWTEFILYYCNKVLDLLDMQSER